WMAGHEDSQFRPRQRLPWRSPRPQAHSDTRLLGPHRSYKAQPSKANVALAPHDNVIVDRDAQGARGLDDLLRHLDVGARRGGIAGWVVVHQHQGGCRKLERSLHHLAHIDGRMVDGAFLLDLVGDELIALVEKENAELLPRLESHGRAAVGDDLIP